MLMQHGCLVYSFPSGAVVCGVIGSGEEVLIASLEVVNGI